MGSWQILKFSHIITVKCAPGSSETTRTLFQTGRGKNVTISLGHDLRWERTDTLKTSASFRGGGVKG